MQVLFTPSAREEFLEIIDLIRQDDRPMAAERFRKRCLKALQRLELFPESGRRIPEFPDFPHREVIVRRESPIYKFEIREFRMVTSQR